MEPLLTAANSNTQNDMRWTSREFRSFSANGFPLSLLIICMTPITAFSPSNIGMLSRLLITNPSFSANCAHDAVTSRNLWPQYVRHFLGKTQCGVTRAKIYRVIEIKWSQTVQEKVHTITNLPTKRTLIRWNQRKKTFLPTRWRQKSAGIERTHTTDHYTSQPALAGTSS